MNAAISALDLLHHLDAVNRVAGRPAPAALIGDWAGYEAVVAPSITINAGTTIPDRPQRFWFGFLGFPVHPDAAALPAIAGGLTDEILVLRDGEWTYRHVDGAPCPDWLVDALELAERPSGPRPSWDAHWTEPNREPHIAAIHHCLNAIRDGEVYQACVCTQFRGEVNGSTLNYYRDVAAATAPVKSAFLQGDWGSVASFSPETFLRRSGATVSSSPIKGTVSASTDPECLTRSVKDVAENIMIVDLVRNDLGRVASVGSVHVPELLDVVPAPGVWHLVSTVTATLDDSVGNDALLDATFPPASVTGTPKIRAAELLAEWEPDARGVYCGAIGFAGPDLELDLNVAIRTVQIAPDGKATLGVGGGITIDSDPDREWQECLDKAAAIIGFTSPD